MQQRQEDVLVEYVSKAFAHRVKPWCGILLNRIVVYGVLAGALALVYLGVQILLGETQLAFVGATLAVAALFQPLRHYVQASVDRRFYRQRYDAARLVEDFGAVLRNEVEVDILSEQLLTVVQETMQSTQVSLWLFKPEKHVKSADFYQGFGSRITAKLVRES